MGETTSPDYPQALAQKGAYWVGNTGYGYGWDGGLDGSEKLMWYFAQELGREANVPAGEALVMAKRRYFGRVSSGGLSAIHHKAMQESTFYGLPMYRVEVPNPTPPSSENITYYTGTVESLGGGLNSVEITVEPTLDPNTSSSGNFYSLGGETQNLPGRPVQPLGSVPLGSPSSTWHGALLESGEFEDQGGFDPVVSLPLTPSRQLETAAEPEFSAKGWFPTRPFVVNRFGEEYGLVIVPGQFNSDGSVERLYSQLKLVVYSSDSDDYTPPTIWGVTTSTVGGGWEIDVHVTDPSGVQRTVVTYEGNSWETLDLTKESGASNHWTGVLGDTEDTNFFVQAVDKAGNVALATNKGQYFALEGEDGASTPVGGLTEWPAWRSTESDTQIPYLPLILRDD